MREEKSVSFISQTSGRVDRASDDVPRSVFSLPETVITVNGRTVKKSQKVREGDSVTVTWTEEVFAGLEAEDIQLKVIYEDDGIHAANAEAIKDRNKTKRDNLYRLRTQRAVWGVPYRVYYMSCNLDHVLYNKRNSTDEEKENDAYAFAKQYKGDRDGFVKFISESSFSVMGDFKESWKFIEKDMNSIERYTNLCICIVEETNCGTIGN